MKLLYSSLLLAISVQIMAAEKQLIGHFFEWNGQLNHVQTEHLTHLVYNHFNLTANANIEINHQQLAKPHLIALRKLKKQQPELKLMASIGGWALSKNYPKVVADKSLSYQLTENIGQFIAKYGFDGISIDWRYPGISRQSTVGQRSHDGKYLVSLLKQIRQTYPDMPLFITTSVLTDDLAYLPVFELSQYVDFIEVLSLDLAGHWQNHTGHASPLYTPLNNPSIFTGSVHESISYLIKQNVPTNKLIISIPAFGHGWTGVDTQNHGLFQSSLSVTPGDYVIAGQANKGLYRQQSIHRLFFTEHYQSYWDEQAQASYLFNDQTGHFVTFESSRSLKAKINYIKHNDLAGISVQNLDADVSLVEQSAYLFTQQKTLSSVSTPYTNHIILITFIIFSVLLAFTGFFYRQKKQKNQQIQTEMTQELLVLKQKLERLTMISETELAELQQQLVSKQQKYRLSSQNQPLSAQLQQMMDYLSKLIQQLSNDPSLLSELHKISSNRNKLLYVQAEKGYTGLYLYNQSQPEYIYSRLKQLKQYYDDDFLIQTHRSYLVNVKKVEHIKEHSDGKFFITVAKNILPIGGSFLEPLKQKYPHWFLPS